MATFLAPQCVPPVPTTPPSAPRVRYLEFKEELPHLQMIVQWSGILPVATPITGRVAASTWDSFFALGAGSHNGVLNRMANVKPGHCATLIYTSGTTGNPKAVMISHDNIIYESVSAMEQIFVGAGKAIPAELRIVSYLPLSHVAAQMLDIATPMVITGMGGKDGVRGRQLHVAAVTRGPQLHVAASYTWPPVTHGRQLHVVASYT